MKNNLVNLPQNRYLIARKNRVNKSLPKKVAIIYSEVKREYFPTERQFLTEKDADIEASKLVPYLNGLGVDVKLLPGDARLTSRLRRHRPDMVINLVDSVRGSEYLGSTVPAMLELLEIPFTGVGMLGYTICMDKYLTKDLLARHGIPVPRFQLFTSWRQPLNNGLHYPVILKLNEVHGSLEITKDSIVENAG